MNDININILRSPVKSTVRKFLGVIYIILSILWLASKIILKVPLTTFDIFYAFFFTFSGIVFIIDGKGISMSSWFGEAYIRIDGTRICIKKGVFSKEWVLLCSEIEQIDFSVIRIMFNLRDKSNRELNYDNLEYEHIQEIKKAIKAIAGEKNIRTKNPA